MDETVVIPDRDVRAAGRTTSPRGASELLTALCLTTAAFVVGFHLFRIRFGVSLNDESLYIAIPYRFLLGGRPFVDEVSPHQPAGLLLYPLIRLYVGFVGGTAGIMLFTRTLFVLFALGVTVVVARALSAVTRWQYALLIALACICFVPWSISNFSYNTLGSGLFAAGSIVGAVGVLKGGRRVPLATAGLAHGFASFSYPPLALAVLAFFGLMVRTGSKMRRRSWIAYAVGPVVIGAVAAVLVVPGLLANAHKLMVLDTQGGGAHKLLVNATTLLRDLAREPALLVAAVILVAGSRGLGDTRRRASLVTALLLPLAVLPVSCFSGCNYSLGVVTYYGLLGIAFLFRRDLSPQICLFFRLLVLPALIAGAVVTYSSNNGLLNAGIGMMPAALATSVGAVLLVGNGRPAGSGAPQPTGILAVLAPTLGPVALLILLGYGSRGVYADSSLSSLKTPVADGPFRGIRTTRENAELLANLQNDLDRLVERNDRILFFDNFPGGYLMSAARPATNTVWSPDPTWVPTYPATLISYFNREGVWPTIVVRRLWDLPVIPRHPIAEFFGDRCRTIVTNQRYSICRLDL